MNKKITFKKLLALGLVGVASLGVVSCGKSTTTTPTDVTNKNNETRPFVMASQEVDQVFSPFYSSSTSDTSVVGMTQISMLSNDKDGNPQTHKQGASVVVEDYEIVKNTANNTSTYNFVLRNDVKFSNGSQLTIKDVLFNLYVYLDPTYNGSATLYSTDIVGLKQYRTQSDNENEQDNFMDTFNQQANQRINNLLDAWEDIMDKNADIKFTESSFKEKLQEYQDEQGDVDSYMHLVEDYTNGCSLFKEEIDSDYKNAKSTNPEDIIFTDKDNKEHKNLFSTPQEIFLYNEGFIKWNKKDAKLEFTAHSSLDEIKALTEEQCKQLVVDAYIPEQFGQVIQFFQTATELRTYIANDLAKKHLDNNMKYNNISGIKYANQTSEVTVNGQKYGAPTLDTDGSVLDGNQVLSITINGEDPKAIWNFAFAVAPMYYYSNQEQISKFDYVKNFGVSYNDQDFRDKVLKDENKILVPVGAGAYKASSKNGSSSVTGGTFFDGTTIYFERNEYFKDGKTGKSANIKNIYFRVVPTEGVLNALYSNSVDYCEPSAKPETVSELQLKKEEGYETVDVKTQGYGYIGLNASKVQNLYVRQAIMHSIKVDDIVSYYGATATRINRSMSSESWAYPKGCTPYYPYVGDPIPNDLDVVSPNYKKYVDIIGKKSGETMNEDEQKGFIDYLIGTLGKVQKDGNGQYNGLNYTFTIGGASDDHPAYNAFNTAKTLLNKCGLQITVAKDSQALIKLTSGSLEVWAAAWSSALDPDMYQVYHKDSKATAILNWGYPSILNNSSKYSEEYAIINKLSDVIMQARKTTDQNQRTNYYKIALDYVMQLAIELPTYQRKDLSAFNGKIVEKNSLNVGEELTSLKGVTAAIWRASLVA